jgi:hypothetical protein
LGIHNVNTCVVSPPNTLTLIFLHYFLTRHASQIYCL